mgnify:CR=1 FL=1
MCLLSSYGAKPRSLAPSPSEETLRSDDVLVERSGKVRDVHLRCLRRRDLSSTSVDEALDLSTRLHVGGDAQKLAKDGRFRLLDKLLIGMPASYEHEEKARVLIDGLSKYGGSMALLKKAKSLLLMQYVCLAYARVEKATGTTVVRTRSLQTLEPFLTI